MSRTFTLAQLKSRLDQMTDTESDTHLSANEKYAILASAAAETWDKITSSGLAEQFVKSVDFSTTAGTQTYAYGTIVSAGDFYKVYSVTALEGTDRYRPVRRVNPAQVFEYQPPQSVQTIRLHYVPAAPTFKTAGSFDVATTFEGINGWEEHLLVTAAITVKAKREDDYSVFARRKQELEARIQSMAHTDWSEPDRVVRRHRRNKVDPWAPISRINGWMPRGSNLELFECAYPLGY